MRFKHDYNTNSKFKNIKLRYKELLKDNNTKATFTENKERSGGGKWGGGYLLRRN